MDNRKDADERKEALRARAKAVVEAYDSDRPWKVYEKIAVLRAALETAPAMSVAKGGADTTRG